MEKPIYFIHMSDSHLDSRADFKLLNDINPRPVVEKVIEKINSLPLKPDFIVHTGDIVDVPKEENYKLAGEIFSKLDVPVYYVTGNHDKSSYIRENMQMGPYTPIGDNPSRLTYVFEKENQTFLVLDGRGADEIDPAGELAKSDFEALETITQEKGRNLSIFLHFPPHPFNSPWIDPAMLLRDGDRFHNILKESKANIRAVFHGHVHGSTQTIKDGILYVTAPSMAVQLSSWPTDETPSVTKDYPPGFNIVTLFYDRVLIRQYTLSC